MSDNKQLLPELILSKAKVTLLESIVACDSKIERTVSGRAGDILINAQPKIDQTIPLATAQHVLTREQWELISNFLLKIRDGLKYTQDWGIEDYIRERTSKKELLDLLK